MKNILKKTVLTLILACTITLVNAQTVVDNIGTSLGNGNVAAIAKYFDNAVSMSVAASPATYSRSQAEMVLRHFFTKNPAKKFTINHSGDNDGNSHAIGTLHTSNGSYRTYFAVKQKDGQYIIQELRIEK
ncbi:MAG TPA: DUF4783 domain-containing protein [Flavipsychrobacter sp.]|nr:DUF4783 domain-containing protein [Flavipsychrobacter sp.]